MIELTHAAIREMIIQAPWYCEVPKEFRWPIENAVKYEYYNKDDTQHFTIRTGFVQCVMVVNNQQLKQFIKNNKIHRHISH